MSFTTKRGRKPQEKTQFTIINGGKANEPTPETSKKSIRINNEAVDICLAKGLITPEEHWSAIHFRWLYTLKFGAPGISALNLDKLSNGSSVLNDELWQEMREREYAMAIEKLRKSGALKIVMSVAIFGLQPKFLRANGSLDRRKINIYHSEFLKFQEGLQVLAEMWCKIKGI